MERKHDIRISFDATRFSHVFIHTAGAYLSKPINPNNNKYLENYRNVPTIEEFKIIVEEINNTNSKKKQNKLINELKSQLEIDQTISAIPLTFNHDIEKLEGYIVFESTSAIENYDLSLLDFISYDFEVFNDYLLFFINFFDYFIDVLDNKDIKYFEIDTLHPIKEVIEIAKKYYSTEKNKLIMYQSIFKKCIHFVYCIDNPFDLSDLNLKQRFFLYNELYKDTFKEFSHDFHTTDLLEYKYDNLPYKSENVELEDINFLISVIKNIDPTGRHLTNLHQFVTNNIFTSFYISLFDILAVNKNRIKLCKNCNKYFITPKDNVAYCDRVLYDNTTCKDIGNKLSQQRKEENDDAYHKYRVLGTRKKTRVSRNPEIEMYQKDLKQYREIGKQMYKDARSGKISKEEFQKWVDSQDK